MALHLGMTVREAMARVSSREFTEWIAYANLEPFGEERADFRTGIMASTVANVNRAKGGKEYKPEDFMPDFDGARGKGKREMSTDAMKAVFDAHILATGMVVKNG